MQWTVRKTKTKKHYIQFTLIIISIVSTVSVTFFLLFVIGFYFYFIFLKNACILFHKDDDLKMLT